MVRIIAKVITTCLFHTLGCSNIVLSHQDDEFYGCPNIEKVEFFYVPPRNKNGGYKKIISSYVMPISSNWTCTEYRHSAM